MNALPPFAGSRRRRTSELKTNIERLAKGRRANPSASNSPDLFARSLQEPPPRARSHSLRNRVCATTRASALRRGWSAPSECAARRRPPAPASMPSSKAGSHSVKEHCRHRAEPPFHDGDLVDERLEHRIFGTIRIDKVVTPEFPARRRRDRCARFVARCAPGSRANRSERDQRNDPAGSRPRVQRPSREEFELDARPALN